MAAKGKWAQGIKPRHFCWVMEDKLALCERPGGYGANHRRVRRQEEIIWVREQGFSPVVSLIPASHNLHNYDEMSVNWRHRPFPATEDLPRYMAEVYPELQQLLAKGHKVLYHLDELGDRIIGLMAGYLVWAGLVPEPPRAIFLLEHITSRQIGPPGRDIVATAGKLRAAQFKALQEAKAQTDDASAAQAGIASGAQDDA